MNPEWVRLLDLLQMNVALFRLHVTLAWIPI
jgi:hypothetical protein